MISLCMIVKNEAEMLRTCLESVQGVVDEIIIVDTGSTDETKKIAGEFTDKVFDFIWVDHFSMARNYAFSKATKDFIMWLDADDVILETDQKALLMLKGELNSSVDAVSMYYHISFDAYGNPTFKYRRNRLVKRTNHFKWFGAVHEYLEVGGNIIHAEIAVTHRKQERKQKTVESKRNLHIYEGRLAKGDIFTPRDLYYYANELKDHRYYRKAIKYYKRFLETKKGWIEDVIRAHISLADCYRVTDNLEKEREYLIKSLIHDIPRPEVSCRIADDYKEKGEFKKAIIWYCLAVDVDLEDNLGFRLEKYSTWYPHLQLCFCYWKIGEIEMAYEHHLLSAIHLPNDPRVLYNERFFNKNKK